jgi:hypothetical protein
VGLLAPSTRSRRRWLLDEDHLRTCWEGVWEGVREEGWEEDGWQRILWVAVPLDEVAADEDRPSEWQALLPYLFGPAPSLLAAGLKPGQWLVPLGDGITAVYPIGRAVKDVARRMDKYLAEHHIDLQTLPYWMVGD